LLLEKIAFGQIAWWKAAFRKY